MRPRALRQELARASLITTLVALLLTAGSLLFYELASYRTALINDARAQADLIAHATTAAVMFDDRKVAQDTLALLRLKPAVLAAAVLRPTGEPLATCSKAAATVPPLHRDLRLEALGVRFEGPILDVAHPIRADGEVVGLVYLRAEHDLWQQALAYAAILLVVSVVSLSTSFLVFKRLLQRVTASLLRVTAVARDVMDKRDWSLRAPESQNLDVAVLVRAFNGMLEEVQRRTGDLERSNEELARSNERLERETQERRHAEEELRRLDRRKDEFIATLAHELRNPLAPMMNAAALLRLPTASDSVRHRAASIIDRQLRHMTRFIDDLLDVSRIMTGKLSLHRELLDMAAVLQSCIETAQPMFSQRQQSFTFVPPAQPLAVVGDQARLNQVLSNVLSNASRYTPEHGRIELALFEEAGHAVVQVRDNGIGIEPQMQERIFDLFEQADKSLERGSAGLGIGLTLARQLVQLHGGTLSVHSEGLGRGSCFTARLPLADARPCAESATHSTGPATGSLDVLVADDNVDYAQSLAVILESQGHRVRVVHDGLAAIEAAATSLPDVALLDIGMPGLNGYEVARRLRREPGALQLRLVAITGWGQAADKASAANAGFDHHLVKPVPVEELLSALSQTAG